MSQEHMDNTSNTPPSFLRKLHLGVGDYVHTLKQWINHSLVLILQGYTELTLDKIRQQGDRIYGDIDETIASLQKASKQNGKKYFYLFNGTVLLSTDSTDDIYMNYFGHTKKEYKAGKLEWLQADNISPELADKYSDMAIREHAIIGEQIRLILGVRQALSLLRTPNPIDTNHVNEFNGILSNLGTPFVLAHVSNKKIIPCSLLKATLYGTITDLEKQISHYETLILQSSTIMDIFTKMESFNTNIIREFLENLEHIKTLYQDAIQELSKEAPRKLSDQV